MTQWLEETVDAPSVADLDPGVGHGPPDGGTFLRPGEVFGPWRLVEHVADGGFGSVWRATAVRPVETGRRTVRVDENAAIKFFAATTDGHRRRIVREVALAQRLGGQWTPELFGSDLDAIPQWAAFEYIGDATLHDLVRSTGPLSGDSLAVFAEDLWDALSFFRRNGVAHRDLTPTNIHVHAQSARPRVIDWGNARDDAGEATHTAPLPRTAGYAAPELVEGRGVGPAADLWSWGAVVCFAATGHPPLPCEGYHQRIVTCDVPLDLAGVPGELLPALDAALRWDPDDRDPEVIAGHLPGRQAHVQLEAAREREAELDLALDDLRRRVRLRDERIEELGAQIEHREQERRDVIEVVHRLRATEAERDEAGRELTALRARVAGLENELASTRASVPAAEEARAALRRARRTVLAELLALRHLRWRNRRLQRRLDRYREHRHQVATPVPLAVAGALTAAATVLALVRATWESRWLPVPFVLLAVVGVAVAGRCTARSGRWTDQVRAGALAVVVLAPFLAPIAFSAGAMPSRALATWVVHAPFVTPPPPDSLGVGHGARGGQVDPDDCTEPVPANSYWDVLVIDCG